MSPKLDSPVQTQMAVSVLNHSLRGDPHGNQKSEAKPVGRRRVFVQTETGLVLGMDLDRGDNAHTVKRRLQLALNFPTEESSLTFGDLVLKNDLTAIRRDSPLLLTRNNLHRSSSTPCLSPCGKDQQQRDSGGPIEVLGCSSRCSQTKQLVRDVAKAIKSGVDPIPVHSGLGGAYYFRNSRGESIAIVKPTDEEPFAPNNPKGFVGKALGQPGLKGSVRVGETGFREVAAYLLDYDCFANVPPTVLVKITHSVFHVNAGENGYNSKNHDKNQNLISKIASFQKYISHDFDASDHGTSSFPVAAVHRIGILDVRIFNTDRHAGNLLVRKVGGGAGRFGGQMELIPIDHGLCLPENLEDPYFEWIHWPQASIPFSEEELEYIANLDPARDSEMLRMELPMIREACLRILVLCTIFLKEAAAFGLCLSEIGGMMSREFKGKEEEPSELELVCIEAKRLVAEKELFPSEAGPGAEDEIQFNIDFENPYPMSHKVLTPCHFGGGTSIHTLSKLEEGLEEEDEDDNTEVSNVEKGPCFQNVSGQLPSVSSLSVSLKGIGLHEKHQRFTVVNGSITRKDNSSSSIIGLQTGKRSACEQLQRSKNFVKLSDMGEERWVAFLEKFQELLHGAFRNRKSVTSGQMQRLRLGTSCKF
ncbi:putative 1-phosphatidylinositol 4-kinase [Dioscorea sansibarensis]